MLAACTTGVLLLWLAALGPGRAFASVASHATDLSANWAGYVATPSPGSHFRRVAGSWKVPTLTCIPGHDSYSAAWVGLGGYLENAGSLEQAGTDADCTDAGQPRYGAWYELLPAGPVDLGIRVHPGDELEASVSVAGDEVSLRIEDASTGAVFAHTIRVAVVDDSTAEWVVEAPSQCVGDQPCSVLPLADFGQVDFTSATASTGGSSGSSAGPHWSTAALELEQRPRPLHGGASDEYSPPRRTVTLATPSASSAPYGAFAVTWSEQTATFERPTPPPLPGFGGG